MAMYTCDVGFTLTGDNTRFCMDDDQMDTIGIWNGTSPSCERKLLMKCSFKTTIKIPAMNL